MDLFGRYKSRAGWIYLATVVVGVVALAIKHYG
jgi:hypothetical protein